ncbi:class I SAM-dependent methyltransferase [Pseudanabaena sp. PCC 6802]|uniref:class I SAM-dependent methyltransferase n=1 Tax=Pseudanabaena sp. PCC 6802 TaxID=118173 RepID=UPI00034A459A|nr:methyltransferase domain-containing protein [Pseudanabaena sp. PCC 6802]
MTSIKLHIGGKTSHPEWQIVDIEPRPEVDYVCDASDLSQFADNSVSEIYASHVLEHFHYALGNELLLTLLEWYRVLKPQGKLMLSVPDLRTLCWLYLNPDLDSTERYKIMRMIFGGQINQYDVHKVGFDFDLLATYLSEVGFQECQRVAEFNLFKDCSSMRVLGNLISLNVIATK